MGILRADILTHSQLEPSGSVFFDGNSDYLSWSNDSVKVGTSDFTLEAWIYAESDTGQHQTIFMAGDSSDAGELVLQWITTDSGSALGSGAPREIGIRVAGTGYYSGQQITFNQWHHVAVVRSGGTITFFLDGEAGKSHAMTENLTTGFTQIGARVDGGYNGYFKGYISNARIALGAIYKNNFTPSKFELKNVAGTLLLCCQSSTSATTAEVVPSAITANGTAAAAAFHPDLKKDITDTGVVFDGFGNFATSTYMVPPSGKTAERNRGLALFGGGETPSKVNSIEFVNVQSMGIAKDFGDFTTTSGDVKGLGSSTRGVFRVDNSPSLLNTLEFITFANQSNATDFGDLVVAVQQRPGASNQTRGIFSGGLFPGSTVHNDMDYITIATLGNAADFGNLSVSRGDTSALASSTRMIVGGGYTPSTNYGDVMDFVTIATTGNAADFGDLNTGKRALTAVASSTRGVFGPGKAPSVSNVIDFVTIASTGNATDFGDALVARGGAGSASNSIRGLFSGGYSPSKINSIEFITIATTGNGADFGDMTFVSQYGGGCSDSHGGLS